VRKPKQWKKRKREKKKKEKRNDVDLRGGITPAKFWNSEKGRQTKTPEGKREQLAPKEVSRTFTEKQKWRGEPPRRRKRPEFTGSYSIDRGKREPELQIQGKKMPGENRSRSKERNPALT